MKIFAGSASLNFTQKLAEKLGLDVSLSFVERFSEGNILVKLQEDVHNQETVIVQTLAGKTINDDFMELLFWIDALKRYDAAKITVVTPFFAYGKSDKQDGDGTSIRARVCADCLQAAGADKFITMDLHSPSIPGFFAIPVENLSGLKILSDNFKQKKLINAVVVSPDAGFAKQARKYAAYLNLSCVIGDKNRPLLNGDPEILEIIGEVAGKNCLIVDDFTTSAGTLVDIAFELKNRGAERIIAAVTHAPLDDKAVERVEKSPIEELMTTNTITNLCWQKSSKLKIIDVSDFFAKDLQN